MAKAVATGPSTSAMTNNPQQLQLANRGNSDAQFNVALHYQDGTELPQDYAKACYWYRKAAHQGHAAAQYGLALLLGKGLGHPKDEREAAAWYRMAAEQGHQAAQFSLAVMYENGQGVPKNLVMAYVWFALAGAGNTLGPYVRAAETGLPAFRGSLKVSKGKTVASGNRNRLALLFDSEEYELAKQLAEDYYIKHFLPFH
jgi:hypothetical protein